MPTITIPARARFVLYLIGLVGGLAVTLALAKGWLDAAGAAFVTGVLAILNGLAAGNVNLTKPDASVAPEPDDTDDDEPTTVVESAAGPIVPAVAPKRAPRKPRAPAKKKPQ